MVQLFHEEAHRSRPGPISFQGSRGAEGSELIWTAGIVSATMDVETTLTYSLVPYAQVGTGVRFGEMMHGETGPDFIEVLACGLDVVRAFGPNQSTMILSEVAAAG